MAAHSPAGPGRMLPLRETRLGAQSLKVLVDNFNSDVTVLVSERQVGHHQKAAAIAGHLSTLHVQTHLCNYDDPTWTDKVIERQGEYYIFVGFPLKKRNLLARSPAGLPDDEVAKVMRRVSQAVVVVPDFVSAQRGSGRFLDRFLHVDFSRSPEWLAEAALSVFAAPSAKAHEDDFAYWSAEPKLVDVWRREISLGLSIMTREMSTDSLFQRIVLIKGFNESGLPELHRMVGKYTHIQSVNGILLDGLKIEQVTDIFHMQIHPRLQLLVRYIHPLPINPDDRLVDQLPNRHSTYVSTRPPRKKRSSIDGSNEAIPITLSLIGNHFSLNRELFAMLTSEEPLVSPSQGDIPSPVSSLGGTGGGAGFLTTQLSETGSMERMGLSMERVSLIAMGHGDERTDPSGDVSTPLDVVNRSLTQPRKHRTSCKDVLYPSNEYIERACIPPVRFDIDPELPGFALSKDDPGTPVRPPVLRQASTPPEFVVRKYILQMLKPQVDRQFTHLFLKPSGIFLIVVSLDEIVAEPLIQYENLFYLLRMIHTHMRPSDIKRVIVIGMYHSSRAVRHRGRILQCVNHLNAAIRAAHMTQNFTLPVKEGGFVFMFDQDHPSTELVYLCGCIRSLMDIFMERAWYYRRQFFEAIFMPFPNFSKVLSRLATTSRTKVVESAAKLRKHVGAELPEKYFETLAMLSPAFIGSPKEMESEFAVLQPSFLLRVIEACNCVMTHREANVFELEGVFNDLPVVSAARLRYLMTPSFNDEKEQNAVIRWMKRLEIIHSIQMLESQNEIFFVPLFANEDSSTTWDNVAHLRYTELIVYLLLTYPVTEQLFHKFIAVLLSDVFRSDSSPKRHFIAIKHGCTEAILPLRFTAERSPDVMFEVFLKHHPIQNIIEVRTRQKKPLEFLKAIEDRLLEAFQRLKFFDNVESLSQYVVFHTPARDFSPSLKESALWRLSHVDARSSLMAGMIRPPLDNGATFNGHNGSLPRNAVLGVKVESERDEMEEEEEDEEDEDEEPLQLPEDILLKTKFLTHPSFRSARSHNAELKNWASSDPDIKERNFPTDLREELQRVLGARYDYWSSVASHLDLLTVRDINFYAQNVCQGGNGVLVYQAWVQSTRTHQDLVQALDRVGLQQLSAKVNNFFAGSSAKP